MGEVRAMNEQIRNSGLYSEGFLDGQNDILDEILLLVDDYGSWREAEDAIRDFVNQKKREVESL